MVVNIPRNESGKCSSYKYVSDINVGQLLKKQEKKSGDTVSTCTALNNFLLQRATGACPSHCSLSCIYSAVTVLFLAQTSLPTVPTANVRVGLSATRRLPAGPPAYFAAKCGDFCSPPVPIAS